MFNLSISTEGHRSIRVVSAWTRCLEYLAPREDLEPPDQAKNHLYALALTCKLFYCIVQPWIFRRLQYDILPPAIIYDNWSTVVDQLLIKATRVAQLSKSRQSKHVQWIRLQASTGYEDLDIPSEEMKRLEARLKKVYQLFLLSISRFTNLRELHLTGVDIDPKFLSSGLRKATKLEVLSIVGFVEKKIRAFIPIKRLLFVSLSDETHDFRGTIQICRNDKLEELNLHGLQLTTQILQGLTNGGTCPNLKTIKIDGLTPESFPALNGFLLHCPNLHELNIADRYIDGLPYQPEPLHKAIIHQLREFSGPGLFFEYFLRGRHIKSVHITGIGGALYPPIREFFHNHLYRTLEDVAVTWKMRSLSFDVPLRLTVVYDLLRIIGKSLPFLRKVHLLVEHARIKAWEEGLDDPMDSDGSEGEMDDGDDDDDDHMERLIGPSIHADAIAVRSYESLIDLVKLDHFRLPETLKNLKLVQSPSKDSKALSLGQQHQAAMALGRFLPKLDHLRLGRDGILWVRCGYGCPWSMIDLERQGGTEGHGIMSSEVYEHCNQCGHGQFAVSGSTSGYRIVQV